MPGAFLVLPRVRSQVYVPIRASTGDDLINQPDQAKGFTQDTEGGVVVPILSKLIIYIQVGFWQRKMRSDSSTPS